MYISLKTSNIHFYSTSISPRNHPVITLKWPRNIPAKKKLQSNQPQFDEFRPKLDLNKSRARCSLLKPDEHVMKIERKKNRYKIIVWKSFTQKYLRTFFERDIHNINTAGLRSTQPITPNIRLLRKTPRESERQREKPKRKKTSDKEQTQKQTQRFLRRIRGKQPKMHKHARNTRTEKNWAKKECFLGKELKIDPHKRIFLSRKLVYKIFCASQNPLLQTEPAVSRNSRSQNASQKSPDLQDFPATATKNKGVGAQ